MTLNGTPVRPTVALIFGGNSSEHQISCLTAGSIAKAIDPEHFDVIGIGITPSGRWVQVPVADIQAMQIDGKTLPELDESRPTAVLLQHERGAEVATVSGDHLVDRHVFDVAFALLHGPFGEDGTVQGLFEMTGVRYVGSGVTASAAGMDKHVMKMVLEAQGLPVGPYFAFTARQWATDRQRCLDGINKLQYPVFVKPARGGSSVGISRITDPAELVAAIEDAQQHDPKVIVEQGFVGVREVECGVLEGLNGGAPDVSPVAEIRMLTADKFYDFESKYTPEGQVEIDLPADLTPEVSDEVRRIGALAFDALDCEGFARADCFVDADGKVWVNELNTMPGCTATSMFPQVWAHAGVAYPQLIDRLISTALERPLGLR